MSIDQIQRKAEQGRGRFMVSSLPTLPDPGGSAMHRLGHDESAGTTLTALLWVPSQ